ncbi:MAG: ABC transporter ATP-binding protein [Gammaproteobacteria bacterium]
MSRIEPAAMIRADSVVYEYPGKRALDAVTFELTGGSITALVGPNGAGKTTLLRCLAALDQPYAGSVEVSGVDVLRNPREAHRHIGYLPDHFGLYADLNVQQCLRYAGAARGLEGSALEQRIPEVMQQLGLADKSADKAGSLSRGQRQRLAIAQSIIHRPRVLLLDEPASGLDPEARADLSSLMRRLGSEGMTLIVSSHILAELEEYCTGMLVLQEGRMVEHRQFEHAVHQSRRFRLRLSRPDPSAAHLLASHHAEAQGLEVSFQFDGDDDALAALLASLVTAGVPVCELAPEDVTLQDAYLKAVGAARKPDAAAAARGAP